MQENKFFYEFFNSFVVEAFATNQDLWADKFQLAFDKMGSNGYQTGDLVDQTAEWEYCSRNPPTKGKKSRKGSVFDCGNNWTTL